MKYDFELADYNINIDSCPDNYIKELKSSIRKNWMAPTRKKINRIYKATEYNGDILAIEMDDNPPLIGGYITGILFDGWGVFHYDNNTLYVNKIKHNTEFNRFYFRNRKNINSDNNLGVFDNEITVKSNENEDIYEILNIITSSWDKSSLNVVSEIKKGTNSDTYIIKTDTNTSYKINDKSYHTICPSVPTGESFELLLNYGWAVCAIKRNMIFITRISTIISNTISYITESVDNPNDILYTPEPCEECGNYEFQDSYISGFSESNITGERLPDYVSLCNNCYEIHKEKYITQDEYRERYVDS